MWVRGRLIHHPSVWNHSSCAPEPPLDGKPAQRGEKTLMSTFSIMHIIYFKHSFYMFGHIWPNPKLEAFSSVSGYQFEVLQPLEAKPTLSFEFSSGNNC